MECNQVLEILAAGDPTHPQYDDARTHLVRCGHCWDLFNQLAQSLLSPLENEISCAECRDQLALYHHAEANGLAAAAMYPDAAAHLARCVYCAVEYEALREVTIMEERGQLPVLTNKPQFDLSFLKPAQTEELWIWNGEKKVRTLFAELVVNLSQYAASFGKLPHPLSPQMLPVAVTRDADSSRPQSLRLPEDVNQDFHIQIILDMVGSKSPELTILLEQNADQAPCADVRIMLYDADHHLLSSFMTREDGRALFTDMTPGRYIIQVRWQSERWEVPVHVAELTQL
ncbi:MAG: carboxypeptidase-like regulatory domain-containing protein [Caldilineaceae bacterium]